MAPTMGRDKGKAKTSIEGKNDSYRGVGHTVKPEVNKKKKKKKKKNDRTSLTFSSGSLSDPGRPEAIGVTQEEKWEKGRSMHDSVARNNCFWGKAEESAGRIEKTAD